MMTPFKKEKEKEKEIERTLLARSSGVDGLIPWFGKYAFCLRILMVLLLFCM